MVKPGSGDGAAREGVLRPFATQGCQLGVGHAGFNAVGDRAQGQVLVHGGDDRHECADAGVVGHGSTVWDIGLRVGSAAGVAATCADAGCLRRGVVRVSRVSRVSLLHCRGHDGSRV